MILRRLSKLYWKIAAIFMALILLLAGLFLWITVRTTLSYFLEANQRLNAEVAKQIAADTEPFVNGNLNKDALEQLFHNVMVLHPSVEVYLLDQKGGILAYSAPDSLIRMKSISLIPLEKFIADKGQAFLKGPDPRHPGETKVFSAAPVRGNGKLLGYIYVILRGDQYASVSGGLFKSYWFKLGLTLFLVVLLAALLVGLFAFMLITRNLDHVIGQIRDFQDGKPGFRMKASGELSELAGTFNRMVDTIEKNMQSIRAMEQSRRELVANVSHDLRTPLSTIRGYAETLLMMQASLDEENREKYTRVILNSAVRLKEQVDELFELSKLEGGEIRLNKEPFSISELAVDNARKYGLRASERRICMETDIQENIPLAYADIGLMDRVLQNLLDNSLKFTPEGGKVCVQVHRPGKGPIEVAILDTGTGMSPDELSAVFDRYVKVKKEHADNSGIGLGLAIVKSILDLHEIPIRGQSQVGEGSKFSFALPVYRGRAI